MNHAESTGDWADSVRKRQRWQRQPQKIAEVVGGLMARTGYGRVQATAEDEQFWREVTGDELARHSRIGNLRRGVLEITVRNSAMLQELTFQKRRLLERLAAAAPERRIRDLRFRVGEVD